jgi:hypothetical protein
MTAIITEAIRNPQARRQSQSKLPLPAGEQFIKFVMREVFVFIKQTFPFSDGLIPPLVRLNEGKQVVGRSAFSRIQILVSRNLKNLASVSRQDFRNLHIKRSARWDEKPNAISNAVGYAKFRSGSHPAIIRVYDEAGSVIETHDHWRFQRAARACVSRC